MAWPLKGFGCQEGLLGEHKLHPSFHHFAQLSFDDFNLRVGALRSLSTFSSFCLFFFIFFPFSPEAHAQRQTNRIDWPRDGDDGT